MIPCARLALFAPSYILPLSSAHCFCAAPATSLQRLRRAPSARPLRAKGSAKMSSSAPQVENGPPLFIYGSLLATEVMSALIERVPVCQPGEIQGYHRYGLTHRPYPGLVQEQGSDGRVQGLIVCGLSEEENAILDYFEGDEYVRQMVKVHVRRSKHQVEHPGYLPQVVDAVQQESIDAVAYLWKKSLKDKLVGSWEPQDFLEMDIVPAYAANAKGYGVEGKKEWRGGTYAIRPLADPNDH